MSGKLGGNIKEWRVGRGLTLDKMAAAAQVSKRTLIRWEQDQSQPRLPELEAVLAALQVTTLQRRRAMELLDAPRAAVLLRQESAATDEAAPPLSGDLLRAMRLRKGRTLEDTAQEIGLSASVISRWERSEMWPEPGNLHRLCYALGAGAEEVTALTTGRLAAGGAEQRVTTDELRRRALLYIDLPITLERIALMDLQFYTLAADLWKAARRSPEFHALLGAVYADYTDFLFGQNRYAECEQMGLMTQDFSGGRREGKRILTLGALRAAEAAAERGGKRGALRGAAMLRDALPFAPDPFRKIWMLRNLGRIQQKLGRVEEVERLAEEALSLLPQADGSWEYPEALDQIIHLFSEAGRYHRALEVVDKFRAIRDWHPSDALRMTKIMGALGKEAEAQEWLQRAYIALNDPGYNQSEHGVYIPHFRQQADLLAAQF